MGSGGDVVLRYFLSKALVALLFGGAENHLCEFGKGHYEKDLCEIILQFGPVV